MTRTEAINRANENYNKYGGGWNVVKIGDEYYDVHDAWFKIHKGESLYRIGDDDIEVRVSVMRRLIIKFNKFLLWLLRPLIDAGRNYRKT